MNQVMEMLRLVPGASENDAITRLSTLFDMMSRAPGFRQAEVLRSTKDPGLLLVLHAWESIDDWHTFQASDTKIAFAAGRPAFLYNFEPCGMNWSLEAGVTGHDGDYVHREVVRAHLTPQNGQDVVSSCTFSYQDYEPSLEGAMLRLTRSRLMPDTPRREGDTILADDVYVSLHQLSTAPAPSYEFAG